jgi:hypothetical protein
VSTARTSTRPTERACWPDRVERSDWEGIRTDLDALGFALTGPLLTPTETKEIAGLYDDDSRFRSTIDMVRYRFGEGEYRYFTTPFPAAVDGLRHALYPKLVPVARDWWAQLGRETAWPDSFDEWLERCHRAGQTRPTPILLRYEQGGWNALHRDLYGDLVFPLQVVINLTRPDRDYTGGEFILVEQRPRAQSRPVGGAGTAWGIDGRLGTPPHPRAGVPRRHVTLCRAWAGDGRTPCSSRQGQA